MNLRSPGAGNRLAAILLLALVLSGCGQKGDLYLPDRHSTETGVVSGF